MKQIEKYNIFEESVYGPELTSSCVNVDFTATFSKGNKKIKVKGFYNGAGEYLVRFMPDEVGVWHYELRLTGSEEINKVGDFECIKETGNNHGPVIVNGMNFKYADGTKYIPIGTTIYAWIHQPKQLIEKTIDTLSNSPFNKVRMCVFPKGMIGMPYNNNDPELFPFEKDTEGKWDVSKPNFEFWKHLEEHIKVLLGLGIEADLILFHPYDRWGFSKLCREESLIYLDYCVRRLAAFRNIWWSLANEYDMLFDKNEEDWTAFCELVSSEDPYHRLLSVHNWLSFYDASKPWITHCSIQTNQYKMTRVLRDEYKKPVVIDECRYEGDIEPHWGNISAFEMVHRFWAVMLLGGYCTHGETFHREDDVLWWAKGGELYGKSVKRIAFLKDIMYELDGDIEPGELKVKLNPNVVDSLIEDDEIKSNPFEKAVNNLGRVERYQLMIDTVEYNGANCEKYFIKYLGKECRVFYEMTLPEDGSEYTIDVIDIWEMTRTTTISKAKGKTRVSLPGKEGIVILATRI